MSALVGNDVQSQVKCCTAPRDVVIVQGDDAATFLHSQLAQNIADMAVGTSVHSFVLEPSGHVVAVARVFRHVDTVFTVDVDAGLGDAVVTRLRKFVLRAKVTMRNGDWSVRTYWGAGVSASLAKVPGSSRSWWGSGDVIDVVLAPEHDLPVLACDVVEVSVDEWHALRTDSRWPCVGRDIEVGDVPATTGLVNVAASFTKGCYPGQELVERMDSRGSQAPVSVRSCARDGLATGETIVRDGVEIATVTSVGARRALARVKRGVEFGIVLSGDDDQS